MTYPPQPEPDYYDHNHHPQQFQSPPNPNARRGFAVTALVLGILAVCFSWVPFFGWALCILAIVFGALSLRHGMGKAGLILGILGAVLAVILYMAIFAGGNSTTTTVNRGVVAPVAPVVPGTLTIPQPGSPVGSWDTNQSAQDAYLTMAQDSVYQGGPYTDAQLAAYGKEACTDGAYLDPVGAGLQLALDESIPNYDAGYIATTAAFLLCTS